MPKSAYESENVVVVVVLGGGCSSINSMGGVGNTSQLY